MDSRKEKLNFHISGVTHQDERDKKQRGEWNGCAEEVSEPGGGAGAPCESHEAEDAGGPVCDPSPVQCCKPFTLCKHDSWSSRVMGHMVRQALVLLMRFCGFLKQNSDLLQQGHRATGAVCCAPESGPGSLEPVLGHRSLF